MSEWLQNIGKKNITAADISDTNYEEFERLDHDNVKAVNDANDNFIAGVEEQARASIEFYNHHASQKSKQFGQLADLTKSGIQAFTYGVQLNEIRKEYDEAYNAFTTNTVDQKAEEQGNDEKAIEEAAKAARRLTGSGAIDADAQTIWDINTVDGRLTDMLDSKKDALKLGGTYLENWWDVQIYERIPIPEKFGGGFKSLDESRADTELFKYIQKELGIIYLNELRSAGYSEKFIRRHVTPRLFEKNRLALENHEVELASALAVENKRLQKLGFYQKIQEATLNGTESTIIHDTIAEIAGPNPTRAELVRARQIVFGWVTDGINSKDLEEQHVRHIGNEQIPLKGSTTASGDQVYRTLSEHWGSEYQAVRNLSIQKNTDQLNSEYKLQEAKERNVVVTLTQSASKNGIRSEQFRTDLQLAKDQWNKITGGKPYPASITSYMKQVNQPVLVSTLQEKIEYNLDKGIFADTENLIQQLPPGKLQTDYYRALDTIGPRNWDVSANATALTEFTDTKTGAGYIPKFQELDNLKAKAAELYKQGYDDSIKSNDGVDIPHKQKIDEAHKAGILNVETGIRDILAKDKEYFKKLYQGNIKEDAKVKIARPALIRELQQNPGIISSEEEIVPDEKLLLQRALPYIKGETDQLPVEWKAIAKFSNTGLNAHDLVLARLEALDMLPEGIKAKYSNEKGYISRYEAPGGDYRLFLAAQDGDNTHLEFAEAIGHLQVNYDKGGYDYTKGVEFETPLSQQTLGDVLQEVLIFEGGEIVGAKSGIRLGMYDLNANQLGIIASMIGKNDQYGSFLDRTFDQDLQDELVFMAFKAKLDQNKTLQGATSQEWAQTLNISPELAKELHDIYPLLMKTPYLQIKHLLPDVAKALLLELSGTQ